MKISSVRPFLLSYPFREPLKLPFYGGERTILKRDAMLIRIETDNGLVGYAPGPGSERTHRNICEVITPFLEGRTLADPDALRVQFQQGPGVDPQVLKDYCVVEVALYDLIGKDRGVPVSELLGGGRRDRLPPYGRARMLRPPEGYTAAAQAGLLPLFTAY